MKVPDRKYWIRALSACSRTEVFSLANELSANCEIQFTINPQAGLALLTLKDGAFNEPFYLGEIPLAKCCVEIELPDGKKVLGGAQIMDDDAEFAKALAILDGILFARFEGWERIARLIMKGLSQCEEIDRRRRCMLATTRVDFSLLNEAKVIIDENEG